MDEDGTIFEGSSKGKLYYSQNIMNQVDRCGKRSSEVSSEDEVSKERFRNSILGLEAMLAPYADSKFNTDKKKIIDESNTKSILNIKEYFIFWGILSCLIRRAGLMPLDEASITDDDDKPYNPVAT